MSVKIHKTKEQVWTDAAGNQVPLKYISVADKKKEAIAGTVHKFALLAESMLSDLHKTMTAAFEEVRLAIQDEFSLKGKKQKIGKGSLTWFNFDKSIKVEMDINEISKWDGALMTEALTLLNKYIGSGLDEGKELIKDLITSAFSNNKGMVDSKKVFQIIRFESKTTNKTFLQACELLKQAHSIDKTKSYMRVWEKVDSGEYRQVNLNFSSI